MSKTTRLVQIVLRPQNTQVFQAWTLRRASKQTAFCEKSQVLPRTCLRNSICVSCRCLWPIWTSLPTIKNKKILRLLCFIIWIMPLWSKSLDFTFFWRKCCHFDFRQGMGFTRIVKNFFERNCENWSENEFTSFGENAITLIFARGWDSLGLSKKTVKKSAKIGQKLNSLLLSKMPSLQFSTMEGIHYDFRKKWWKKRRKLVRKWILYPISNLLVLLHLRF